VRPAFNSLGRFSLNVGSLLSIVEDITATLLRRMLLHLKPKAAAISTRMVIKRNIFYILWDVNFLLGFWILCLFRGLIKYIGLNIQDVQLGKSESLRPSTKSRLGHQHLVLGRHESLITKCSMCDVHQFLSANKHTEKPLKQPYPATHNNKLLARSCPLNALLQKVCIAPHNPDC